MAKPTHDLEAFQKEYVELCLKHGFEIDGCGCCGSPWITRGDYQDGFWPVPTISWPKEVVEAWKDKAVEDLSGTPLGEFKM
jgi:hypothetical protein